MDSDYTCYSCDGVDVIMGRGSRRPNVAANKSAAARRKTRKAVVKKAPTKVSTSRRTVTSRRTATSSKTKVSTSKPSKPRISRTRKPSSDGTTRVSTVKTKKSRTPRPTRTSKPGKLNIIRGKQPDKTLVSKFLKPKKLKDSPFKKSNGLDDFGSSDESPIFTSGSGGGGVSRAAPEIVQSLPQIRNAEEFSDPSVKPESPSDSINQDGIGSGLTVFAKQNPMIALGAVVLFAIFLMKGRR